MKQSIRTKCLILPLRTTINPSILSNLIGNGFGPTDILYKMSQTEIFSYNFSFN